jgi:hypothetical protein
MACLWRPLSPPAVRPVDIPVCGIKGPTLFHLLVVYLTTLSVTCTLGHVASDVCVIVDNGLERMCKEVALS